MSTHYLSEAGLYRATLEQMLYGAPSQETEAQGFHDSVFERKDKKVIDLVNRFENNMKMDDTTVEIKEDKDHLVAQVAEVKSEIEPVPKVRQELSMERFVSGILRTSSPIPEVKKEDLVELTETPILPYRPAKIGINFGILDTGIEMIPAKEATKTYRSCLKSEGRRKVSEAKGSTTPKPKTVTFFMDGTPDSAYASPGSSSSSTTSTPSGSLPPVDTQTASTPQLQEEHTDIYLKLSRALLHDTIKKYAGWKSEKLRPISVSAASIRLKALQKISSPCEMTQLMQQMYEKCIAGEVVEEMNTIVVAIFHLLDEDVHAEVLSVPEEYIVRKYCKKVMQLGLIE